MVSVLRKFVASAWLGACAVLFAGPAVAAPQSKSPIKSDEEVVFFPTAAAVVGADWLVPIHGWIYEPERKDPLRRGFIRSLMGALGVSSKQVDGTRFRERIGWFLVDNERGKRIPVTVLGTEVIAKRSRSNGHFRAELRVPRERTTGAKLSVKARTRPGDQRAFVGEVQLIEPTGISVVSDIDDTIKVTEVTNRGLMLTRTFLREFEAVSGMASVYRDWEAQGAVFHYVSASPWHLYRPLAEFLVDAKFPRGTFDLREFRVKDRRIANLLRSPQKYKLKAIRTYLLRYPQRRFVLIGDSSERDPQIFASLAREFPNQVQWIAIRQAPGTPLSAVAKVRIFRGIKATVVLFSNPSALSTKIRPFRSAGGPKAP